MLAALVDGGGTAATLECSSHALWLERLAGCAFDVAVFLNLTRDHLDDHGTMEAYFEEKAKLFSLLKPGGQAVVNADDPWGRRLLERLPKERTLSFSLSAGAGADVTGEVRPSAEGISLRVVRRDDGGRRGDRLASPRRPERREPPRRRVGGARSRPPARRDRRPPRRGLDVPGRLERVPNELRPPRPRRLRPQAGRARGGPEDDPLARHLARRERSTSSSAAAATATGASAPRWGGSPRSWPTASSSRPTTPARRSPSAIADEVAAGAGRGRARGARRPRPARGDRPGARGGGAGRRRRPGREGTRDVPGHGRAEGAVRRPARRPRGARGAGDGAGGSEEVSLSLGPDLPEVSRAAVFGLAKSGLATIRALLSRDVYRRGDRRGAGGEARRASRRTNASSSSSEATRRRSFRASTSASSRPASRCRSRCSTRRGPRASRSIAEVELASRLVPGLVVGITGTNGKSTTTALAAALLRDAGREAVACGNFGTPWIHYAADGDSPAGRAAAPEPGLGRRALVLPARGAPPVRARRGGPPEPDARPPRPLPFRRRLRRRQGPDLREPGRGAGRGPERRRPARGADPDAGRDGSPSAATRDAPARRVAEGRRLPRRRRPGRDRASTPGARTCSSRARTTPRTPSPPSPRRFPLGVTPETAVADVPHLQGASAPDGPREDPRRRLLLQRLEGDEHRRDAEEPRGLPRRERLPDPRREGQGRRLPPPPPARLEEGAEGPRRSAPRAPR